MTPNELVPTFRGSYVCVNFGENRSRNATVRVLEDGQTDTHTHTHTQTQTDFIICPMLYAIAMGHTTSAMCRYEFVNFLLGYSARRSVLSMLAETNVYLNVNCILAEQLYMTSWLAYDAK